MEENIRLLKPYLRGLPIIVLAMVIGVMAAKKYLNYTTPMYESAAKLRLADVGEGVPNSNLFKDFDVFVSSNKIAAEIEILKSQVLLDKVLDQLDFDVEIFRIGKIRAVELYQNSPITIQYFNLNDKAYDKPFDLTVDKKHNYSLSFQNTEKHYACTLGDTLHTEFGSFLISLNKAVLAIDTKLQIADQYKFEIQSRQKLFSKISKNIDIISIDKDVAVIRISYKSATPAKAANLVNKLAEVYIQDYIDTKYKTAKLTVNFLEDQINSVLVKLSSAENQIQSFRDVKSITNISQETETDLRKLSQLKILQTNLKMNLRAIKDLEQYIYEGQDRFLELAPNFEAFTDLLSTEIVKKIKALQSEKKDLLLVYTPEDEKVRLIDEKLADLTTYLTESIKNTRKNLEIKYKNLTNDIEEAEKKFIGVPEKEKMLTIMNREFNIYQHSYNFLNEKKIEAEIAQAAKISFHRIISPAEISKEPVSPNRSIITIVSAILGMLGAMLLIFIVHTMKAKVNDLHTIESNSTVPVAILTPKLNSGEAVEKHFLREAIQLEIKGLLTANSLLCMTSYQDNEGAKFNALHLAKAFASQDRSVLLVDVDNQLNMVSSTEGKNKVFMDNILVRSLTNPKYNAFTKEKMKKKFEEWKSDFDVVIVLNESLVSDAKSKLIMSLADVNLVVLDARLSPEKRILETDLMKQEYKFPSMFFLLNRNGYNPNVVVELMIYIKKAYKQVVSSNNSMVKIFSLLQFMNKAKSFEAKKMPRYSIS